MSAHDDVTVQQRLFSFLAGSLAVAFLLLVGLAITSFSSGASDIGPAKQLIAAAAIGLSTGRYVGRAIRGDNTRVTYIVLGFFLTIAATVVVGYLVVPGEEYFLGSVPQGFVFAGIIVSGASIILFLELSGAVDEEPKLDAFIDTLEQLALAGLAIVAVLQYVFPFLGTLWDSVGPFGKLLILVGVFAALVVAALVTEYNVDIREEYVVINLYVRRLDTEDTPFY